MQNAGLLLVSAPQITGHPLGLPGADNPLPTPQKVQPILDARNPETQLGQKSPPETFWYKANGEPHPQTHEGPPSIMQIKITRLLNEQANTQQSDPSAPTTPEHPREFTEVPEPVFLPFESRKPNEDEPENDLQPTLPEPQSDGQPVREPEAPARLPAYEEAANLSLNSVFSTLP